MSENLKEILEAADALNAGGWLNNEHTAVYTVRVARAKTGELIVIDSDDDTELFKIRELIDDWHLWPATINGLENIPSERGVYVCQLQVRSVRYPATAEAPVEYDIFYSLLNASPYIKEAPDGE